MANSNTGLGDDYVEIKREHWTLKLHPPVFRDKYFKPGSVLEGLGKVAYVVYDAQTLATFGDDPHETDSSLCLAETLLPRPRGRRELYDVVELIKPYLPDDRADALPRIGEITCDLLARDVDLPPALADELYSRQPSETPGDIVLIPAEFLDEIIAAVESYRARGQ